MELDKLKGFFFTVIFLLSTGVIYSQDKEAADSLSGSNSMFVDAASDSRPRLVSLGLPTNASNAVQTFEDGLPVSYYIYQLIPYKSYHGGVSSSKTETMGPFETAMRNGEINFYSSGTDKEGGDKFKGVINYTIGSFGQNKIDLNISGPIARNWYYSLSSYQNFDPGSNHLVYPYLKDRHQYYKGVLSHHFADNRGTLKFVYQHVKFVSLYEIYGPFVFVGDGSVKAYNGFNLGIDSYRPSETYFTLMDFKTGEVKDMDYNEGSTEYTDMGTFEFSYKFDSGITLDFRSRFKNGHSYRGAGSMSGIDNVVAGSGYTYEDGTEFTGLAQKRMILHFDAFDTMWLNNLELNGRKGNHKWTAGLDHWFDHGGTVTSSSMFVHEVKADPKMLKFKGESYFNFNTAGEYYDGHEHKTALYVADNWKYGRFDLSAFIRAEWLYIHGDSANNIDGDTTNSRTSGFNLTKGKITPFSENYLNGAAGFDGSFKIIGGLSAEADYTFTRVHSCIFNYGGYVDPSTDPSDTHLIRFGFAYTNSWINVLSQINWIRQSNYNQRTVFQHVLEKAAGEYPEGYTESKAMPITYGISSLGWVTDAMITPGGGFNLHVAFTLRNPLYKDFVFDPVFSDGVQLHYDFSNKNVTNLHKVELTLEPSYTRGSWKASLTARYISKQYVNKTNSLYFKGRVETFAGIDYKYSDHLKFTLSFVNLLNQKGASGTISAADLIEDTSAYTNYVMSGTFIRPFTVELGVNVSF